MTTILAISGSLRRGSYNTALLRAAAELAPDGCDVEVASIADVPLYDGDVEAAGLPDPVRQLAERVAAADALLLATPEYNNGIPGVLKNAVDWLSRTKRHGQPSIRGKKVGLVGATPGRGGTRLAQAAWLPVFRTLDMAHFSSTLLYVDRAHERFEDGSLVDATIRDLLDNYMEAFTAFVAA